MIEPQIFACKVYVLLNALKSESEETLDVVANQTWDLSVMDSCRCVQYKLSVTVMVFLGAKRVL